MSVGTLPEIHTILSDVTTAHQYKCCNCPNLTISCAFCKFGSDVLGLTVFLIVLKIICWQGATWVTTDSEAAHIIITTLITWSITQCNPLFKCHSLRWEPTSLLEKHQQKWENWSVTFQVNKSCIAGFGRKWWKKNVLLQHPDKDINAKATVALKTNENIRWDER